jgi:opacity protein-like surface antigen
MVMVLAGLGLGMNSGVAAGQVSAGIQGNWGSEMGFGIGARGIIGLGALVRGFETVASLDYFFPGGEYGVDLTYWEANANLFYRFDMENRPFKPYVGAGINFSWLTASTHVLDVKISGDETRSRLNLVGGFLLDLGTAKPFLEGRVEAGEGSQVVASVGVRL